MENGSDDKRDVDSAGVYFMSVDDFEWRPKASEKNRRRRNESEQKPAEDGETRRRKGEEDEKARGDERH